MHNLNVNQNKSNNYNNIDHEKNLLYYVCTYKGIIFFFCLACPTLSSHKKCFARLQATKKKKIIYSNNRFKQKDLNKYKKEFIFIFFKDSLHKYFSQKRKAKMKTKTKRKNLFTLVILNFLALFRCQHFLFVIDLYAFVHIIEFNGEFN